MGSSTTFQFVMITHRIKNTLSRSFYEPDDGRKHSGLIPTHTDIPTMTATIDPINIKHPGRVDDQKIPSIITAPL